MNEYLPQRSGLSGLIGAVSPRRFASLSGWTVSFVAHGVTIFALALVSFSLGRAAPALRLEPSDAPALSDPVRLPPSAASAPSSLALASWESTDSAVPERLQLPAPQPVPPPVVPSPTERPSTDSQRPEDEPTLAEAGGGEAADAGAGGGRGASYFGIDAPGKRFVYVVDSSTSMRGKRWTNACSQLLESLERLGEDCEFYVIFFDRQTHLMFRHEVDTVAYQDTSEETLRRVRNWMRGVRLGNRTFPMTAVQVARSLNPDAIFLLSDGEFMDQTLIMLRLEYRGEEEEPRIPIHTIALFSDAGIETLREIAQLSGGQFRNITRRFRSPPDAT